MIRLALFGAAGRMGRLIVEVLPEFPDLQLAAAVVSASSKLAGQPIADGNPPFAYSTDIVSAVTQADIAVDFSRPNISLAIASACAGADKACLIGTTGHTIEQRAELLKISERIALLIAPNASFGIFVTTQLAQLAARLLGDSVDIEIAELHHRGKRDAPSGTAKALATAISEVRNLRPVGNRFDSRQDDEIGVTSLRGGDVVGEHTVYFLGDGERIELTHRALDRRVFARGALRLAEKLALLGPGLKQLGDLV